MTQYADSRLGLFWFISIGRGNGLFAAASLPWPDIQEVGGFKTYDKGHVDVWPAIQRQQPSLRRFEYEHFPRGRVNWRRDDYAWLVLLDPNLNHRPFIDYIVRRWSLPQTHVTVLEDSHYQTRKSFRR